MIDTDLEVARLHGAYIEQFSGYTVVKSPDEPYFHWGNYLVMTDDCGISGADAAESEVSRAGTTGVLASQVDTTSQVHTHATLAAVTLFAQHFPQAKHLAIGWSTSVQPPPGISLDSEVVLSADAVAQVPLASGYQVARLRDWESWVALELAAFAPEGTDAALHLKYLCGRVAARRRSIAAGHEAWFGAYRDDELVASLGIVLLPGGLARFQSISTAPPHRRRGLASHLISVAADWARGLGHGRLVIVADADGEALRLYNSLGFSEGQRHYSWYRADALGGGADRHISVVATELLP